MRLIELRLKNLNSLKGEWHIDFSDDAFVNEGIFAITGQTGAGKTTILDAICLALYGETPRISNISKSTNEVMTRQTGDCFAEVVIDIDGVHYRCHWGQRRAHGKPDGNLQDATHEISQANNHGSVTAGTIIEHKASLTKKKIVELTRMDFQQFTRSILLAQGSFSAFLKAKSDERADILEKITGTDIYATISQRAFEKKRDEENKLEQLQATLKGLALLDPEAETQLKTEAQTLKKQLEHHRLQLESLDRKIKWCDEVSQLTESLTQYEQDLAKSEQAQQGFNADAERLDNANKALEIEGIFNQLQSKRQAHHTLTTEQQALSKRRPVLQQQLDTDLAHLTHSQQLAHTASTKLNKTLPIIAETRELDASITQQRSILNQNTAQQTKLNHALLDLKQQLKNHTDQQNEQKQQLQQLDNYLSTYSHHQKLTTDIGHVDNLCVQLKNTLKDSHTAFQSKTNKLAQKEVDNKTLQELAKSQATIENELKNNGEKLASLRQQQANLLQGHSLAELRQQQDDNNQATALLQQLAQHLDEIEALRAQLKENKQSSSELSIKTTELAQQITASDAKLSDLKIQRQDKQLNLEQQQKIFQLEAKLEDYRDLLEEDNPCPLCGSTHHPYIVDGDDVIDNADSSSDAHQRPSNKGGDSNQQALFANITEQIKAVDSQIEQFDNQLSQQKIALATAEHDLNQKQNQLDTLSNQLESKVNQCQHLTGNFNKDNERYAAVQRIITQYQALLNTDRLLTDLASTDVTNIDTDKLNQLQHQIQSTIKAIQPTIDALNTQKQQFKQAVDDNDAVALHIQHVESDIRELESKHQAIVININNANNQLHYLDEGITEADRQLQTHAKSLTTIIEQLRSLIIDYDTLAADDSNLDAKNATKFLKKLQESINGINSNQTFPNSENESFLDPLRALRKWLHKLYTSYHNKLEQKQDLNGQINTSSVQITEKQTQIKNTEHDLAQLNESIEIQAQHIKQQQQQRHALFADKDVESEENLLRSQLDDANKTLTKARDKHTATQYDLNQLVQNFDQTQSQLHSLHTELSQQETAFTSILTEHHFVNEQAFIDARLPKSERDALTTQKQKIAHALQVAQNSVSTTKTKLTEKLDTPLTTEDKSVLTSQRTDIQQQTDKLIEQLGAINQQLTSNGERKGQQQAQLEEICKQKQSLEVWSQLSELIGSATGKKFRTFAQGLTFDIMVTNANAQLQKMSDRYLLIRDEDSPLELNVIDNYQAGLQRSTKNLSGGEGFIISLALALGLSNMASHNIRVDSLFLDEGFGTLDEDSLDIALNTLTSLQQEGKLIGVISHVQVLKERIHTQIRVDKLSGGHSQISGPGCSKISK